MKVLISADMEGVCGVTSWVQVMPPEYGSGPSSTVEYERARARLTREVNAAGDAMSFDAMFHALIWRAR